MERRDTNAIADWHAHIYFGADTREAARALREAIITRFGGDVGMGRFHERPVGPHPQWSYQLGVPPARFAEVVGWLALNRNGLDVFIHPNTGDALRDHRDSSVWIGRSHELDLAALDG